MRNVSPPSSLRHTRSHRRRRVISHDIWNRVVAERVERRKMREVVTHPDRP